MIAEFKRLSPETRLSPRALGPLGLRIYRGVDSRLTLRVESRAVGFCGALKVIGTLRGVGGGGVGGLNAHNKDPYPPKGPYEKTLIPEDEASVSRQPGRLASAATLRCFCFQS